MTKELVVKHKTTSTESWSVWVQRGPDDDPYGDKIVIQSRTGEPDSFYIGNEWGNSQIVNRRDFDAWILLLEAARAGTQDRAES